MHFLCHSRVHLTAMMSQACYLQSQLICGHCTVPSPLHSASAVCCVRVQLEVGFSLALGLGNVTVKRSNHSFPLGKLDSM